MGERRRVKIKLYAQWLSAILSPDLNKENPNGAGRNNGKKAGQL